MLKKILQKIAKNVLTKFLQRFIVCLVGKMTTQNVVERRTKNVVNTQLLEECIYASGKTKTYLANKMGITLQTLRNKCTNKSDFKLSEVDILCNEIGVKNAKDKNNIFLVK